LLCEYKKKSKKALTDEENKSIMQVDEEIKKISKNQTQNDNETNWSWYNPDDEQIYFVIKTQKK